MGYGQDKPESCSRADALPSAASTRVLASHPVMPGWERLAFMRASSIAPTGYSRVSTVDQDPQLQFDALAAPGCDDI